MDYRKKSLNDPIFNPVKKKVALLSIINEAPLGGEDLAIVAQRNYEENSQKREIT